MKIIAIGTKSRPSCNVFSGQSVMFDGLVSELRKANNRVTIVDISQRFNVKSVLLRSFDYVIVLIRILFYLTVCKYDVGYITTAQSRNGLLRDSAIVGLLKLFRVRVVAHQYGANYDHFLRDLDERGLLRLKRMLDYILVVIVEGKYMKKQYSFLECYEDKVKVIPNGLPFVGKGAMVSKLYNAEQPFKIFYLSNMIWSKGYFDVLQAVDLLYNKYKKNVECIFAGKFLDSVDDEKSGISSMDSFDQYIIEHHLEEIVSYYPGMYGELKDATFSAVHVFLLPSYYINEGQPVAILEALAYGCVPIVTKYRHIPMMVSEEIGIFVEPKNPEHIAKAVMWLMEHPIEYNLKSKKCIEDYKDRFTFDKYVASVVQVLKETVKVQKR